jgi:hypothetical protein
MTRKLDKPQRRRATQVAHARRNLTVVMLASDGAIAQWMLGNDQPDLSVLGAVRTRPD